MDEKILTVKETAETLQLDPNTLYRWIRAGRFPGSKVGREWRVLKSDLIKFVEFNKHRTQFLSKPQEAEMITALVGRHEIPLKFQYFEEGAERYTSFTHAKEYGGGTELDIISDNQIRIADFFRNKQFNLLDLGCGDGKKAIFLIKNFEQRIGMGGYFALDLSQKMLNICVNNTDLALPNMPMETFQQDFEQGNIANITYYLSRRYQKPNLIFFVGNTLANISDAHRTLINLLEGMTNSDILVAGIAYYNPKNIPLHAYNKHEAIEVMWTVPEKIGIKRSDAKIYWIWNDAKRQVECYLEFLNDWSRAFGANFLKFLKHQRIRLAISRRFTKESIFELFAGAGFKIELSLLDKDENNVLVFCKPHTWEAKI